MLIIELSPQVVLQTQWPLTSGKMAVRQWRRRRSGSLWRQMKGKDWRPEWCCSCCGSSSMKRKRRPCFRRWWIHMVVAGTPSVRSRVLQTLLDTRMHSVRLRVSCLLWGWSMAHPDAPRWACHKSWRHPATFSHGGSAGSGGRRAEANETRFGMWRKNKPVFMWISERSAGTTGLLLHQVTMPTSVRVTVPSSWLATANHLFHFTLPSSTIIDWEPEVHWKTCVPAACQHVSAPSPCFTMTKSRKLLKKT